MVRTMISYGPRPDGRTFEVLFRLHLGLSGARMGGWREKVFRAFEPYEPTCDVARATSCFQTMVSFSIFRSFGPRYAKLTRFRSLPAGQTEHRPLALFLCSLYPLSRPPLRPHPCTRRLPPLHQRPLLPAFHGHHHQASRRSPSSRSSR
jgi:hypothetical protein